MFDRLWSLGRNRRLSDLEPRFICTACGKRGAAIRPDFPLADGNARMVGQGTPKFGKCCHRGGLRRGQQKGRHAWSMLAGPPHDPEHDTYLVLDDLGGMLGCAWRETDVNGTDRETLSRDLIDGQYNYPVRYAASVRLPRQVLGVDRKWLTSGQSDANEAEAVLRKYQGWRKLSGSLGCSAMRLIRSVSAHVVFAMILSAGVPALGLDAAPPQTEVSPPNDEVHETNAGRPDSDAGPGERGREALCLIIESAAKSNDLPLEFFVRVIWQESRFEPDAVGPVTRNGKRALGIAQFMPGTASERRLLDPFDPVQALPKSAEFLNELRQQFGNLGLAAAAYNAGPRRVQDWLAGSSVMPQETRNYVLAITGSSVDDWALADRNGKPPDGTPKADCRGLLASLQSSPHTFASALEHRVTRAAGKLWGVQIAAGFNRDNALEMYARAMKSLSATIGEGHEPLLVHSAGTNTFYHVLIGTDTRREADDLCNKLRRAGGACLVKPNQEAPRLAARGHAASKVHLARRTMLSAARLRNDRTSPDRTTSPTEPHETGSTAH